MIGEKHFNNRFAKIIKKIQKKSTILEFVSRNKHLNQHSVRDFACDNCCLLEFSRHSQRFCLWQLLSSWVFKTLSEILLVTIAVFLPFNSWLLRQSVLVHDTDHPNYSDTHFLFNWTSVPLIYLSRCKLVCIVCCCAKMDL